MPRVHVSALGTWAMSAVGVAPAPTGQAVAALRALARRGAWRDLAADAGALLEGLPPSDDARAPALAWRALALARCGDAAGAAATLRSAGLGDASQTLVPTHLTGAPSGTTAAAAMRELRLLWAELPALDGRREETLARLYSELDASCSDGTASDGPSAEGLALQRRILTNLLRHHVAASQYPSALAVAGRLVELAWKGAGTSVAREGGGESDSDRSVCADAAWSLSQAGMACLQMGAVPTARELLERSDAAAGEGASAEYLRALHAGLLAVARTQWAEAEAKFESAAAAARRGEHGSSGGSDAAVADNNAAVCKLYSRRLPDAVRALEGRLQDGLQYLSTDVVGNLASMYELESADPTSEKQKLGEWIAASAPDDFDRGCLRLS